MTDPMTTERLAEISERLTTPRLGRSMARETDLDLLAIRALLAEVRRLQAAVERVRELHRPGNYSASRGVWTWWDVCPTCGDKAGVHPCGRWLRCAPPIPRSAAPSRAVR